MSGEKGSSKADTLVKAVLVLFISLLSFSVGTFVGKQVSDSDHRRMALEGEYKADRQIASTDESSETSGDKITEKEVESLTEEFVNKEKSREPAEAAPAATAEAATPATAEPHADKAEQPADKSGYQAYPHGKAHKVAGAQSQEPTEANAEVKSETKSQVETDSHKPVAHSHANEAARKTAEKVVAGKAPTDGKKEERKPQSVLPSVASSAIGKYSVQVASYADEGQAKNHAADLKGKGLTAFYLSANIHGHTWYRVMVGLFENMKSASDFRAQLMKDNGVKSAFVQKIVQ
jgi:cell division protein FtsN